MGEARRRDVVVTGVGLQTPLGSSPGEILGRMEAGEVAASRPAGFDASAFACRMCAEIAGFRLDDYVGESKAVRLMSRDAQLAVAAARLAVQDAGLRIGTDYAAEDVALFAATGLASMAAADVAKLVRNAAAPDGSLDLHRFGAVALKRVRPVLSFKILSNMPICFVSIFEGIRGPNAVYTPWEGQGAQAIASGIRAIRRGEAPCALVGGCDVKTNEFAFVALQQQGVFRSWQQAGAGPVPGEGAAFVVLEEGRAARARGARVYARCGPFGLASVNGEAAGNAAYTRLLAGLCAISPDVVVAADDGDPAGREAECRALTEAGAAGFDVLRPKRRLGNLFAGAAPVQFGLAAAVVDNTSARRVLANCFGHGSEQAAFVLEPA